MKPEDRPAEENLTEAQEQGRFAQWLLPREKAGELWFDWSATHQALTNRPGTPDFIIKLFGKPAFWIEFKSPGGRFSPAQKKTIGLLRQLGGEVFIAATADEAIELIKKLLT
jgi:hypothetical protein